MRERRFLLIAVILAAACSTNGLALTTERDVMPAYVAAHPDEFTVKVEVGEKSLIEFTITHHVPRPMYHVARLAVVHGGKILATSETPLFGKRQGNVFHFSIARESVADSTFDLSDSALSGEGENAVPLPGTIIHRFRLRDFVPKEMLKAAKEE